MNITEHQKLYSIAFTAAEEEMLAHPLLQYEVANHTRTNLTREEMRAYIHLFFKAVGKHIIDQGLRGIRHKVEYIHAHYHDVHEEFKIGIYSHKSLVKYGLI